MWSTFLLGPDANKHGVSSIHTVHFQFSQGKMFLIWLPLRWWGFVQCMDTWPQEQFHGQQKIPSGEAPRIPEGWNQIPVSFTVFPVRSVLNHHCTAFTLDKSYSPRRRFRSEGFLFFCLEDRTEVTQTNTVKLAVKFRHVTTWALLKIWMYLQRYHAKKKIFIFN